MAKKLPKHVTKLENGKYRVRYRKSKKFRFDFNKVYDTYEEAIQANEEYIAKNTLNLLSNNSKKDIGFSDFCDYFFEWYKNKAKRPSQNTLKGYRSKIKQLKKLFGNVNIREITTYQIEISLSKEKNRPKTTNGAKKKEKISAHTLHHEFTMLRLLFNKAYSWGFIESNPMIGVEEPFFEEKEIKVPDYEDLEYIENLIYTCPIRERCQFLLTFYTGMREEEVCGVHIEDFNEVEKYVAINRAVVQDDETRKFIEDKTKSQKSVRKIPLPSKFFDVLNEYYEYRRTFVEYLKMKTNGSYQEKRNLFLNKDGDFYRPHRVSEMWRKFAQKHKIDMTFHGLRHYYITNQMNYNDDLSPRDVQELAGHSNIKTTYRYVHSSQNRIQNNATNLFSKFSREELYKNGNDTLTIPISHIATIILGNPRLSKTDDLQITLKEISKEEVDFFNISNIMEYCKDYLLSNYPSLTRIEKYKYGNLNEKDIIKGISKEFGREYQIENLKTNDLEL